jgi:hypothetical protein
MVVVAPVVAATVEAAVEGTTVVAIIAIAQAIAVLAAEGNRGLRGNDTGADGRGHRQGNLLPGERNVHL